MDLKVGERVSFLSLDNPVIRAVPRARRGEEAPKGMTNQLWGDRTMQNKLGIIAVALAVVLFSSTLVLAQAAKASGTVVVVEKEVVQIKGADGKTYQVKMVDVMEKNLKTGDMVEYEVVEGKPMKVAKKKM